MTQHQTMLDVSNISVEFGGLKAVSDFSMQVKQGTIHALIGPNGAGKSTVFNCISRFYTPNQGSVKFMGEDLIPLPASQMAARGIARSFQNLELFSELTALDNVLLGTHALQKQSVLTPMQKLSRLFTTPDKPATEFAESLLERVGLADARHVLAKDMNFGHQKLLELARAMAIRPKLLLLDEPAAGLRNREIESLDRILKEMVAKDGMTVLLVEHVMQLVMSISDEITVLAFGKKIAEGVPKEVANNPLVIEAYLGTDAVAQAKGAQ